MAQVSPTTIYKYFPNKEVLFSEAMAVIWQDWVTWSYNGQPPAQNLESVLSSARKLFWIKQTHPLFAKILHNTLHNPNFVIQAVSGPGRVAFQKLASQGEIAKDDFDKRLLIYAYSLAGILTAVHVTETLSPTEAEKSLAYALKIFDVSEAKVNKIFAKKIEFPPTK